VSHAAHHGPVQQWSRRGRPRPSALESHPPGPARRRSGRSSSLLLEIDGTRRQQAPHERRAAGACISVCMRRRDGRVRRGGGRRDDSGLAHRAPTKGLPLRASVHQLRRSEISPERASEGLRDKMGDRSRPRPIRRVDAFAISALTSRLLNARARSCSPKVRRSRSDFPRAQTRRRSCVRVSRSLKKKNDSRGARRGRSFRSRISATD